MKIDKVKLNRFLTDYRTLFGLWILLGIIATVMKYHSDNNFLIFRGVFWHTSHELPLFEPYPEEYSDVNHYGPFFSLVIAPFALLPEWFGLLFWCVGLSFFLYAAVRCSGFTRRQQLFILWFCAHELLTALYMQQFNIAIAAIIVLAFWLIEKERDIAAAFFIMLGTFVKLYGIVGLAFFFFSKHKVKFILSLVGWSVVMFVLPMLISSPDYIWGQYVAWFECLTEKNAENVSAVGDEIYRIGTNISLLGLVRRISGIASYNDLWIIIPGLVLFALPYLRVTQYKYEGFRQTLLASVLLFTVLFSTGSESSTYIIAFVGVVIWYTACPWRRNRWDLFLMIFAFILTSMSPSDLFPAFLRKQYVQPYALKALPCVLIWFQLCYEMLVKDYSQSSFRLRS